MQQINYPMTLYWPYFFQQNHVFLVCSIANYSKFRTSMLHHVLVLHLNTQKNTSIGKISNEYVYSIWHDVDWFSNVYIYISYINLRYLMHKFLNIHNLPSALKQSTFQAVFIQSPWVSPTAVANFYDFAWPTGYARWSYTKTTSTGDRNQWGRHVWISSWGYGGRKLSILSWCIFLDGYGVWSRNSST